MRKLYALDTRDEYYNAKKKSLEFKKKKKRARCFFLFDAFSMKMSKPKKHKKNSIKDLDHKQQDEEKCPKTKSIIEFDPSVACSIKSLAVKKK